MSKARVTVWLSAAFAAVVLLRLLFAGRHPAEWDVANYMLALSDYDLQQHRPHSPGYPLYVVAGRLLLALTGDPHRALLWLSALLSGLAVPATWLLARRFLDPALAAWAVALAVTNPIAWFYGCVGLPGIAELGATPLVLLAMCRGLDGSRRALVWGTLALGIAGGFRQNLLVFLGPVWLLALWRAPVTWGFRGAVSAILAATVLAWFLPMVVMTGGFAAYFATGEYMAELAENDSVLLSASLSQILANATRFVSAATLALGVAGLVGLPLLLRLRRRELPGVSLLLLAVAVPTTFFLLVYFHKKAYALVLVAPTLVLSLAAFVPPGRRVPHGLLALSFVLGNGLYFLLPAEEQVAQRGDGYLTPRDRLAPLPRVARQWLMPTFASMRARDRRVARTDAVIADVLTQQADTVLVVPGEQPYDARTLMLRWPDIEVWSVPTADDPARLGQWPGSRCWRGRLDAVEPGALAATLANRPSLWLVESAPELAARLGEQGGRVVEASAHRLVWLPPR